MPYEVEREKEGEKPKIWTKNCVRKESEKGDDGNEKEKVQDQTE